MSLTSGKLFFTDTRTRSNIECLSARLRGRLTGGTGLPGARAGSVTAGSFTTCNNSAGPSFTLTPTGLPWRINLVSYDASAGVVTGRISHAQVTVTSPGCATVIDGTSGTARDGDVRFGYTDATARLRPRATGGDLHFYRVRGCLGLWFDGDPATLSATFAVSPRQTITSP